MRIFHATTRFLFRLLFGGYNGVQAFLYPLTLFAWIDGLSFSFVITGLLTVHKHFFPLSLFLLLFLYIAFLILKNHNFGFHIARHEPSQEKLIFRKVVIDIHKVLFIVLICGIVLYVLAAFLRNYYSISMPLKVIYQYTLREFGVMMVLYYGTLNHWITPYLKRGMSFDHALRQVRRDVRVHFAPFLFYVLFLFAAVLLGTWLFDFLVLNLFFPFLYATPLSPQLLLLPLNNFGALFYDVFMIGVAFLLSNLFFSPFSLIISHYAELLHPLNLKKRYAQNKKQTAQAKIA